MLCPETLCFWIMNSQYAPNSCLLARSYFRGPRSHLSSHFTETSIIWDNSPDSRHASSRPIGGAFNRDKPPWLAEWQRQSQDPPPFFLPLLFIFNSEVVYFFMIATSVCSQCQLALSATLCSIIPVLTPKSHRHQSTGCCSNFTGTRHKGTGARDRITWQTKPASPRSLGFVFT